MVPTPSTDKRPMVDTSWQVMTESFGAGDEDAWVIKLDAKRQCSMAKDSMVGEDDDEAYSIQQTSDGGYIVAGETDSFGAGNS